MKKGTIFFCAITSITFVSWLIPTLGSQSPFAFSLVRLVGALSLTGFACAFFISTRNRALDGLWGGMDKAYVVHKWTGIVSVSLAVAHLVILVMARISMGSVVLLRNTGGFPSLVLFAALTAAAVVAKKMNYETWKILHKFMVAPYAIGVYHYYRASRSPFAPNAFNIWMHIINAAGVACAIYIVFIYEGIAFPFKYKITSVKNVAVNTVELTGQAIGRRLSYRPGQFAFFKIPQGDAKIPSRPFTISSASQDGTVQFTIKNLGDHTAKIVENVKVGDEFAISAASGMFDYTKGLRRQIWVAGGVGIAPFRSFYHTDIPEDFSIDLFYAYYGDQGAYVDEIKALNKPNLRAHLIDSDVQGFLTADKIKRSTDTDGDLSVFFCGPAPMLNSLRRGFKANKITSYFHYEEFTFGR